MHEIDDNTSSKIIQLFLSSMVNGETKISCLSCGKQDLTIEDVVWQDNTHSRVLQCPQCKLYAEMPNDSWKKFLRAFNVNFLPPNH
jgi:transcription elongation factor Elf1